MRFITPLRYPGGKSKLTNFIKLLFLQNDLAGGEYVEPYAGGAGIALNLLIDGYVSKIHLNDINSQIYSFWRSVLYRTDELCSKITGAKLSMDEWQIQKEVYLNPDKYSELEVGFATFYLNRTNRSGIILAGAIGGKGQTGKWTLGVRFNKSDLIKRIELIARQKDNIHLYNLDAADLILKVLPILNKKTLVYLDPPYYVKGSGLYQNYYLHDDHLKIAQLVKQEIKLPWVVSYDYSKEIIKMYDDVAKMCYGINYSAQKKIKGAEVMFFSKGLIYSETNDPANFVNF